MKTSRLGLLASVPALFLAATVAAHDQGLSLGVNFGADEINVNGGRPSALAPGDRAGAVAQANWNNLNGANGSAASLVEDFAGLGISGAVAVTWSCPNTWSTTGRGEENNGFPAGANRTLMTGYLDSTETSAGAATVTVSGLGADFTSGGYDVLVYCLGGVAGRGGAYTLGSTTKFGSAPANPTAHTEDAGVDLTDTGTYVRFNDLHAASFTLTASADAAVYPGKVNFRAPINAIQIVSRVQSPKTNIFSPGDPIILVNGVNDGDVNSGPPPDAETVDHAIDRLTQKYLNFLDLGSGFAVTPRVGAAIAQCIRFYTANDAIERDPASYVLEGSTSGMGGPWTRIASGALNLPSGRNLGGGIPINPATQFNQLVTFANSVPYTSYRVTFPTLKNASAANSMQIAEVELLGVILGTAPVITGQPTDQTVLAGASATFSVSASGTPPPTYQWFVKHASESSFSPIAGATAASYTTPPTVFANDHLSQFKVVVSNNSGSAESSVATLTVVNAPVVQQCFASCANNQVTVVFNHAVLLDGTYTVVCSNTIPSAGATLFSENFNAGNGGFTVQTPIPYDGPWVYDAGSGSWTQAGQDPDNSHPNTSTLISPVINVTQAGVVRLTFAHRHSFEAPGTANHWDGGQVRVSVNGGAFTAVPADAFTQNGYNGTVLANSLSDLHGQAAFVENSANFARGTITSVCTLGDYAAGDSIRVAFMAASDSNTRGQFQPNWQIDALQVSVLRQVTPLTVTGIGYGAASNVVVLTVSPGLVADTQVYFVTIQDVHDLAGEVINPNPTTCRFQYGFNRFCADFNDGQLPPGTISSGVTPPYVGPDASGEHPGVFLHLTDHLNSQANYWTVPFFEEQTFPVFSARWKTLLGGIGGADGFSFNVGVGPFTYLPPPGEFGPAPEEGTTNGLSVTVDTYNNGGAEVGLEVRWNGQRLAFTQVGNGISSGPPELEQNRFVDTSVEVSASGWVTFQYDTLVVAAQIPDYTGIRADRYEFAARTGGLNENCWIDDLCINPWTPGPVTIVQQPADTSITQECIAGATFSMTVDGTPPYNVQWYSNNVLVATVSDSLSPIQSYTTPPLNRAANGAKYKAVVQNLCGTATTREALVTVIQTQPIVVAVAAGNSTGACGRDTVRVRFSEPMDPASASNPANYRVNNGGVSVLSAALLPDGVTVELTVSPELPYVDCNSVAVSGVLDFCQFDSVTVTVPLVLRGLVEATGPQNLIVVEAEDWSFNRSPGTANLGGPQGNLDQNSWVKNTALPGYLGSGYVEAIPNLNSFGGNSPADAAFYASPRLDYCINFPVAGTYYLWVRGSSANDSGNNSLNIALDGVSADERARLIGDRIDNWGGDAGNVNAFGWVNDAQAAPARIEVPSPGVHTINLLMREDGLRIDRFILTTDAAFTLSTADLGPEASPRTLVPSDTVPPVITCPTNLNADSPTPAGVVVNYTVTALDLCDGPTPIVCTPPSGSVFPIGTTRVCCTTTDRATNSATCCFDVNVRLLNQTPVCAVAIPCTYAEDGKAYAIAVDNQQACVILDGSGSTDYEGGPLTYVWTLGNEFTIDPPVTVSGAVVTNCFAPGCHTVTLWVSDGEAVSRCETNLCVITASESVEQCILLVEVSVLERKNKQSLIATLKAASASLERGSLDSAMGQLTAFQQKVRAQIAPANPVEAQAFSECVDRILNAIGCAGRPRHGGGNNGHP